MSMNLKKFEKEISTERFAAFINEVGGNREEAVKLYQWNMAIGSSFFHLLQHVEVVLRVAINKKLINKYGIHWYTNKSINFNEYALKKLTGAKRDVAGKNKKIFDSKTYKRIFSDNVFAENWNVPDGLVKNIIPCLTFGFWALLFAKRYEETIWNPALSSIFPEGKSRGEINKLIMHIKDFRNEIAHHQPIFDRDLESDYQKIMDVLNWLSTESHDLAVSTTRVRSLLENRHKAGLPDSYEI